MSKLLSNNHTTGLKFVQQILYLKTTNVPTLMLALFLVGGAFSFPLAIHQQNTASFLEGFLEDWGGTIYYLMKGVSAFVYPCEQTGKSH